MLFNKFVKSRNITDLHIFKRYRNKLTNELRKAKTSYEYEYFMSCQNDSRKTWKKINSMLNRASSSYESIEILRDGISIPNEVLPDCFNNYFISAAGICVDKNADRYIQVRCPDSIFLYPTTESELIHLFSELRNTTSCDVDGIQITPVKHVLDIIAPVLVYVYNLCLVSGVFPAKMQIAKVIALFKKGNKTEISNYRPISILPTFSKGLEKIIFRRISDFLEKHSLLTHCQYAFRSGRSTQLALLEQKELILRNIELKQLTLGILIDFSKAFDSVDHELLLKKLEYYGIRGIALDIVKSYLKQRSQLVEINGICSQIKQVKVGVPQGSILGPLFFNVYVNDLVLVDSEPKYIIYADDTTVLFSSNNIASLTSTANSVLAKIHRWSQDNGLKINTDKTKAILFQAKNKCLNLESDIFIGSSRIELVRSAKTLGVFFDSHMSWNDHIDFLAGKLAQVAGILFSLKPLPRKVKLLLYNALFLSHIHYCCLVWSTTSATNINRLFLLQKKVIRTIFNAPADSHTAPLFKQLKLLTLHSLLDFRLSLAYRKDVKQNQSYITSLTQLIRNRTEYSTRSPEHWHVPRPRTNYAFQMLHHRLPRLLNTLMRNNIDVISCPVSRLYEFFSDI